MSVPVHRLFVCFGGFDKCMLRGRDMRALSYILIQIQDTITISNDVLETLMQRKNQSNFRS